MDNYSLVFSHTLLGVIVDQELRWKDQCNKALTKGLQWATQLNRLAKMSYGASPEKARQLYLSIAVPRFTYAADVWFTPVTPSASQGKKRQGSTGFAKRLARIQSTAARAILGALRSTPTDSLDAHANLLPMHLLMNEACHRAAIRLAAAPEDHPLFKAVARCAKGRKTHIPPLQHILSFADCRPSAFEKWPLNRRPKPTAQPGTFPARENAIALARSDQAHLKAFADGASGRDGVGAAAVLQILGRPDQVAGLKMGTHGEHSVLDAELAGILLAAHLILNVMKTTIVDDATIFTDSQTAISCISGRATGATQILLKAVKRALKRVRSDNGGTTVRLQWCPGHSGIIGNELADSEAKAAIRGKPYPPESIPPSLTNYRPPANAVTLKRHMKEQNKELANSHWLSTEAGTKYSTRYPHLRAGDFLAHTHTLPRARATLLFRLISGHVQLRQHLHRLQAVDSPTCELCGGAPETVAHYLLRCPSSAPERYQHLESRGRDFLRLDFLFFAREALSPLFDFIKATGRFTDIVR